MTQSRSYNGDYRTIVPLREFGLTVYTIHRCAEVTVLWRVTWHSLSTGKQHLRNTFAFTRLFKLCSFRFVLGVWRVWRVVRNYMGLGFDRTFSAERRPQAMLQVRLSCRIQEGTRLRR